MGTSKSYDGINANPNWSHLSRSVTTACETGRLSNARLNNIASNFVRLLGGSGYGGSGRSKIGGNAGIKTAKKLGGFLHDVKSKGANSAFSSIGFDYSDSTRASDAINFLLEYCAGVASTLDESAAKEAERQLLEEIGGEAKTFQELEKNFEEKIEEYGIEELLVKYYAYYIYEHLSIDFYEKLVVEKGRISTNNLYTQLKYFLIERVKNVSLNRDLGKIDWAGEEGDVLVKNIFVDTLKAFENYEG
jgi:hypothetical protein